MPVRGSAISGRSLAGFAAGAVAGVIAGRLVPPIAAATAGSARASAGRDPFEPLIADHRKFVSLLEEMEQSREDAVLQRGQLLLRLKRRLAAHAMAEEDVIYPLLADEAAAEDDAKRLYGDHAQVKILLYRLERMAKNDPEWVTHVGALKGMISEHARHEEEVDFPALRSRLNDEALRHLARDLHREKALVL